MKRVLMAVLACAALGPPAVAQRPADARAVRDDVRSWRRAHEADVLRELTDLLAIPNVAADGPNIRRNAEAVAAMLRRRGVQARLLELEGAPPAVYGELRVPGASRTVVLYAHYDGQPVDRARWTGDPWQPVLRDRPLEAGGREVTPVPGAAFDGEWRLYARSAGDDKSPIVMMLSALDALRASGRQPSVNVKFFFEGEEEAGSPHLREMLTRYADVLRADAWIFCDGPVHQSRRPQLVFGARGTMGFQLTVYGPVRPLHSGHYGNWAPNPGVLLAGVITSMRDADGRILVPGLSDEVRPVTAAERAALAAVPDVDAMLRAELGLGATEASNAPLIERIMLPALNLQGLEMARVGAEAANVIPTTATAAFGVRLVPDQTPEHVRRSIVAHLERQGWHVVTAEPDSATRVRYPRIIRATFGSGGYPAQRTALDAPFSRAVVQAIEPALDAPLIQVPTLGGSLPLYIFAEVLGAPLVTLPTVNHDNNQHGANENLRLQNLWDGIEIFGVLLSRLGAQWRPSS